MLRSLRAPIIQAPMAGVSTPALAAAVSPSALSEIATRRSRPRSRAAPRAAWSTGSPLADAPRPPDYPIAYAAGKALHAAAKAKGEFGYGAQWAGQAAALARALPAADLMAALEREVRAIRL